MQECEKKEQIIYVERITGQTLIPGIITTNPKCENTQEISRVDNDYLIECENGYFNFGAGCDVICHRCEGTGKRYKEIKL